MIHTFAIIRQISNSLLQHIFERADINSDTGIAFTSTEENSINHITIRHLLNTHNPETGIKFLKLLRIDESYRRFYYAIIVLEPLLMINNQLSVNLFEATPYNVYQLSNHFYEIMSRHFNDDSFCRLNSWDCHRIDYTCNLRFNNDTEKNLFLYLSKKTSRYVRKHRNFLPNLKRSAQSTAESNKSVKVMFYDKEKQIQETYVHIPNAQRILLENDAANIVRFEVQCKKGRVTQMAKKYRMPNRCILHFLNENISLDVMLTEYEQSIGSGEFYSLYHAKKRIDSSTHTTHKKNKLYQCLQLIAQARHVDIAEEQFIIGTLIKRTTIIVQGSITTFRKILKLLKDLDINPMPIPKEFRITHFHNPKDQITLNSNF